MSDIKPAPQSPKEALKALQDQAVVACAKEIEALCSKYDCRIVGMPGMAPDGNGGWRVVVRVEVIANPG